MSLTKGAVDRYQNGQTEQEAVVKVFNIRNCATSSASTDERYRLTIDDGDHKFDACILVPTLNNLIHEKKLVENSTVKLEKVVHGLTSSGKSFLTIFKLAVISLPTTNAINSNSTQKNNICPIGMITPFINGIWKFRGRCFLKSPIRPHPVCHFDFVDKSGEIRVVAFRDECNRFHKIIQQTQVYDISGVRVKTADKRWNNLRHDYELTLTPTSVVRLVNENEESETIPEIRFDFVALRDISKFSNESFIDVIGVVENCTSVIPFTNRTSNRDSKRRELTIIDENTSVSVTLWDEQAEEFDEELAKDRAVIAFQRIRVAIYNGKLSLSGHRSLIMKINPDIREAKHLRIWYDAGGRVPIISNRIKRSSDEEIFTLIGDIERKRLGCNGRPEFITVKCLSTDIADDRIVYMSCSNDDCNRKVQRLNSGLYRCDRCNKECDKYSWSYLLKAQLVDYTGAIWVTFFDEQARIFMGDVTPEQYAQAKENFNDVLTQTYLNRNSFQERIFRLRVNEENFNNETMVRATCVSINEIDFSQYGRQLISDISKCQ